MEDKYRYIFQHEENGMIMAQYFTLIQIEGSNFISQCLKKFGECWCPPIARNRFTGLQDPNGIDIYDRDILKNDFVGDLWEVQWCAGKWIVGLIPNSGWIGHEEKYPQFAHTEDLIDVCNHFKKVGNVYENPELINAV